MAIEHEAQALEQSVENIVASGEKALENVGSAIAEELSPSIATEQGYVATPTLAAPPATTPFTPSPTPPPATPTIPAPPLPEPPAPVQAAPSAPTLPASAPAVTPTPPPAPTLADAPVPPLNSYLQEEPAAPASVSSTPTPTVEVASPIAPTPAPEAPGEVAANLAPAIPTESVVDLPPPNLASAPHSAGDVFNPGAATPVSTLPAEESLSSATASPVSSVLTSTATPVAEAPISPIQQNLASAVPKSKRQILANFRQAVSGRAALYVRAAALVAVISIGYFGFTTLMHPAKPIAPISASVANQASAKTTFPTNDDATSVQLNRATVIANGSTLNATGSVLFKNNVDSTRAFVVQNAAAADVFTVDTQDGLVGVGKAPTAGRGALQVSGNLDVSGIITSNGTPLDIVTLLSLHNLTTQNNVFNGPNELVQLTGQGFLPALNGSNLTNLNASNVASGTLSDDRLSTNVALLNKNQTFSGVNNFSNPSNVFVGDGSGLTNLNASNVASGTLSDDRLSTNVALLNKSQNFSGANTFQDLADGLGVFQIQNASGTSNLFVADTLNTRVGIGNGSPQYTLDVNGDINIASGQAFRIGGTLICNANGCVPAGGSNAYVQLQPSTPGTTQSGNFAISGTAIAGTFSGSGIGLTNLDASQLALGTVNDVRLSNNVTLMGNTFNGANQLVKLTNQSFYPALNGSLITTINAGNITLGTLSDSRLSSNVALLDGNNNFTGTNTFNGVITVATGQIQATGPLTVGSYGEPLSLQGDLSSTFSVSDGTNVISLGFSGTPSGSVTYILDAAATPGTYSICTSAGNCAGVNGVVGGSGTTNTIALFTAGSTVGNSILTQSGTTVTANGSINVTSTFKANGTSGSAVTCTSGNVLQNIIVAGGIVTGGNCAVNGGGVSHTLQEVYSNSSPANILLNSSSGGITLQDAVTPLGTTLFAIQSNDGSTKYFAVNANGSTINGSANSAFVGLQATNSSNGSSATTELRVANDTGALGLFGIQSSTNVNGYTSGLTGAGTVFIRSSSAADGIAFINGNSSSPFLFSNGGIERLRIDGATGNVGIGTGPTINAKLQVAGNALFQNTSDTTTAFKIQNAAGNSNTLVADTTNNRIGVGIQPGYTLDVNGDVNISSGSFYRINGTSICGPTATCAPAAGSSFYIQNGVALQTNANFNIQSTATGSVVGILQGANGQTADILQTKDGNGTTTFKVGATGAVLAENSVDSTLAFQIQNAAGNSNLLVADTTDSRLGVGTANSLATLNVVGSGLIQQGAGTNLTVSGNEITDVVRATNSKGDGQTAPDSSYGIWEATTNLVTNGGFESNTTGWSSQRSAVLTRDTSTYKFGLASLNVVTPGVTNSEGAIAPTVNVSQNTTYTLTAWVKGAAGELLCTQAEDHGGTVTDHNQCFTATGSWQRITNTFTTVAGTSTEVPGIFTSGTHAYTYWIDGVQLEQKAFATPYVETNGSSVGRNAGIVTAPATNVLSTAQGWVAARVRMDVPSSATSTNRREVFAWTDNSANNRIELLYSAVDGAWETRWSSGGTSATIDSVSDTFNAGDIRTVVMYWTGSTIGLSVNGSSFTTVSTSSLVPAGLLSTFNIGAALEGSGTTSNLDGDILWTATGTGTLTNTDATNINNFGNTDPYISSFARTATPSLVWKADTAAYNTSTNSDLVFNVQNNSGASLLNLNALNSSLNVGTNSAVFQGAASSVSALMVNNFAGTNVLNVDTVNGRVGINAANPSANFQVAGNSILQATTGSTTLTTSGNEITDASRTTNTQGDGVTPPDSSTGIWEATTNLFKNGGIEVDTSSLGTSGGLSIARNTADSKFGSSSLLASYTGGAAEFQMQDGGNKIGQGGSPAISGSTTYTVSLWHKAVTGSSTTHFLVHQYDNTGSLISDTAGPNFTPSASQWNRTSFTFTTASNTAQLIIEIRVDSSTNGNATRFDGIQLEQKAIATPYVETNGATATRSGGRVQAPIGPMNVTQGWFAVRARYGWPSNPGYSTGPGQGLFLIGSSTSDHLDLYLSGSSKTFTIEREANGAATTANTSAQTFNAGDLATIVVAWTSTQISISINGSSFNTTANTNIPSLSPTTFDIGSLYGWLSYASDFDGDVLWAASGTGTLSNTDATTLNNLGSTDPTLTTLGNTAGTTMAWGASTSTFLNSAVQSVPLQVQSSSGSNLFKVDAGASQITANVNSALFQNTADSTSAFQIQNAAGTSNLFVADTKDTRIGIGTNIPTATLTIKDQFASPLTNSSLTASGNEITDTSRTANTQGDGRAAPDSSYGIWESTTNLVSNGGAESNTTGYSSNEGTFVRDTTVSKFGSASLKWTSASLGRGGPRYDTGKVLAANTTYTHSIWALVPTGINVRFSVDYQDTNGNLVNSVGGPDLSSTGVWSRYSFTSTSGANVVQARIYFTEDNSGPNTTFWTDGMQFEQKGYATPYVETNGSTATRSNASVTAPSSVLSASQGWVAIRVRMGFASSNTSIAFPQLFDWRTDSNNRIGIIWNQSNSTWSMNSRTTNGSVSAQTGTQTFNAGDILTIVGTWSSTSLGLSVNGGSFATQPNTQFLTPSGATFNIGGLAQADSDIFWFAAGAGALTNTDASTLNSFGNLDPTLSALSGSLSASAPTFAWNGNTASYQSEASNVQPIAFQVQNANGSSLLSVDASNSVLTVNSSGLFQNLTDSTTGFQIQNAAGTSNLLVADTADTRLGVGTSTPLTTFNVSGTGLVQGTSNSANSLTLSGNEINDTSRAVGQQGDGRTPPDSSYGIWESTTNLVPNGGAETNTTGFVNNQHITVSRTTSVSKFGSAAFQATIFSSGVWSAEWKQDNNNNIAVTPGSTYTFSLWAEEALNYGTRAATINICWWSGSNCTNSTTNISNLSPTWTRYSVTGTAPAGITAVRLTITSDGSPGAGEINYFDGVQFEQKPVATPYVETNGTTATRSASQVQVPASNLNVTQGWVAERVRMSGSSSTRTSTAYLFHWGDGANTNEIGLRWSTGGSWVVESSVGSVANTNAISSTSGTFTDGTLVNVIAYWTSSTLNISVNGGAFTSVSRTVGLPSLPSNFDIGSDVGTTPLDGEVLWTASGTGTLTNTDASNINNFGNTDPYTTNFSQASYPTMVWHANNGTYQTGNSLALQVQNSSGANLFNVSSANSAIAIGAATAIKNNTDSNNEFTVSNAAGTQLFNVNSASLQVNAANLQATGSVNITNPQGAISLSPGIFSPNSLTVTGSEITDATRTIGASTANLTSQSYDGKTSDSSYGIWEATTNLVPNGGLETNSTGWSAYDVSTSIISRITSTALFGSASMQVMGNGTNNYYGMFVGNGAGKITVSASTAYTASAWLKLASGSPAHGVAIAIRWYDSGGTLISDTYLDANRVTIGSSWQRLTTTATSPSNAASAFVELRGVETNSTYGFDADGVQLEQKAIATPYVETTGGTQTRAAGRVQASPNGLTGSQGWFAARVRYGRNVNTGSSGSGLMRLGDSSNGIVLYWNNTTNWWVYSVINGVSQLDQVGYTVTTPNIGDIATVVAGWTSSSFYISVNGGAFVTGGRGSGSPTITTQNLDIGSLLGINQFDGDILWTATGTGALANSDATALNNYGSTDPTLAGLYRLDNGSANPTFVWNANTTSYQDTTSSNGDALIFAANTSAILTGNLLDLQSGTTPTSKFAIDVNGNITAVGKATFQNGTNSTNAFQIQNSAGTSNLLVADTSDTRLGIGTATPLTTLNASGTALIQGTSNSSNNLTLSGNELTDAVRSVNQQGDGRAQPDSSYGIWEATTNLLSNGGFESNSTGWASSDGVSTFARDTTTSKFGAASLKVSGTTNNGVRDGGVSVTSGTTYTESVWVNAPAGNSLILQWVKQDFATVVGSTTFTTTGTWQRVSVTVTAPTTETEYLFVKNNVANVAYNFWIDGAQVEQKPVATPYVETNGATASRSAARVQAPAISLNSTQGWVAARVRMGWGSTGGNGASFPNIFDWRTDTNNRYAIYWDQSSSQWSITSTNGGTATIAQLAGSFNSGDLATVVAYWTSAGVAISVNGSNFTIVSGGTRPSVTGTTFDLGDLTGASNYLDSDILWTASGTGTLTNTDASNINNFGNTDPYTTNFSQASYPTMVWHANNGTYQTGNSLALQVQNSSGANLFNVSSANGALLAGASATFQNLADSISAVTIKNASGLNTLLNVNTTNLQVAVANLQSSGAVNLSNTQGTVSLAPSLNSSNGLTVTGNEITDTTRALKSEGDGRASPDSSEGIWEATTNLVSNGSLESGISGWGVQGSSRTMTQDTTVSEFGTSSAKIVTGGVSTAEGFDRTVTGLTASATYTASMWVKADAGASLQLQLREQDSGGSQVGVTNNNFTGTGDWQRVSVASTFHSNGVQARVIIWTNGTHAYTWWIDGVQLEQKAYATPFTLTSRSAGRVQAPASNINATQGWAAFRVRMGFASTASLVNTQVAVFSLDDGTNNNRLQLVWSSTDGAWETRRVAGGVGSNNVTSSDSFNAGDLRTVIMRWDATNVYISVGGSGFSALANGGVPTGLTTLNLGAGAGGSQNIVDSDILWAAMGTGILNNTDATALNNYGSTDPTLASLYRLNNGSAGPTFVWNGSTTSFQDTTSSNGDALLYAANTSATLTGNLLDLQSGTTPTTRFSVSATGAVLSQNSTDSTSAFQIQNAAGTSNLFVADTTNTRVGIGTASPVATLNVKGSTALQASSLGTQNTLTVSGNEITDSSRTTNTQGDGRAAPDSSTGIWESTTNLVTNGGFESNATGWLNNTTGVTYTRDTAKSKFGSASLKVTADGSTSGQGVYIPFSVTSGNTYTASVWVNGDSIPTNQIDVRFDITGTYSQSFPVSAGWQRLTFTHVADGTGTGDITIRTGGSTYAGTFWIDGVQVEQKAYATPYVETNGSATTRNNAGVQAPASNLSTTQGWVAARVRMGYASSSTVNNNSFVFSWDDGSSNNRIQLFWNVASTRWETRRVVGAVTGNPAFISDSFSAGDIRTVILSWTSTTVSVSVAGSAFSSVANGNIPTSLQSTFNIGDGFSTTPTNGSNQFDGDILWAATGTGTLSNTDAANINTMGNIDPNVASFAGSAATALVWQANDSTYLYPGYQPVAFQVQGASGVNLLSVDSSVSKLVANSSVVFQNPSNSTAAFQVQNPSGASIFNVDTTNSQISLGSASATPVTLVVGSKNTSGDPTGTNGEIYYNTVTNTFRCFQANVWINCSAAGSGGSGDVNNGGNSYGAGMILGTNDANTLSLRTNGTNIVTFGTNGSATFKNSTDNTSAFQIQNAAATTTLLNADTSNGRISIGGSTGTSSLNVLGSGLFTQATGTANTLTTTGAEMTDTSRTTNTQGDGRTPPDSSFGIWGGTLNMLYNGGGESNTTSIAGYAGGSGITITRDTGTAKFGTASIKSVLDGSQTQGPAYGRSGGTCTNNRLTVTGSTAYDFSIWAKGNAGGEVVRLYAFQTDSGGGNSSTVSNGSDIILTTSWTRYSFTFTTASTSTCLSPYIASTTAAAYTFWTDGAQFEQNSIATPYVETNGGSVTRSNADVQAPLSLVSQTQGWVAVRVRMGFASTATLVNGNAALFSLDDGTNNNRLQLVWSPAGPSWQTRRCNVASSCGSSATISDTFSAGDLRTVIMKWDANNAYISVGGSAFVSVANSNIISGISGFHIGTAGIGTPSDSDTMWFAAGTGTLTNSDATTINGFGNTDPSISSFSVASSPTMAWAANTATYANSFNQSLVLSVQNSSAVNLFNVNADTQSVFANANVLFQNTANSTTALQVQNSSANSVLTVDTTNGLTKFGTNGSGGLNGQVVFNSATASNYAVTLGVSASQAASYTIKLPTAAPTVGQCLEADGVDATQLIFTTCGAGGGGGTDLQGAYNSSIGTPASIVTTAANKGLLFKAGSTFDSSTLFQVQNAAGNNYIQVDTSGANLYLGNTGIASTVQIGNTTGSVIQTINIGNNATASSTSNINIGSNVAGTTTILGASGVNIATGSAAGTVQIGNNSNAVNQTIRIGNNATGSSTNTVTVGSLLGTSSTTIQGGTGATAINLTQGSGGTIVIGATTGASAVSVQCGTGLCGFGNNATDHSTTLGSTTGTSVLTLQGGSGGITATGNITASGTYNSNTFNSSTLTFGAGSAASIQPGSTQALNITGHASSNWTLDAGDLRIDTTAANGTLNLGNGSQAKTIQIGNTSGAVAQTINIGNNATASSTDAVTIGSLLGTSSTTIQGGTGATAISLTQGSGGTIVIGAATGASAVNVQCGTGTCGFGNNATDHSTTIGSTTGSSLLTLQGGSSGVTVTGNINASGTYNGNILTSSALTFSGVNPAITASTTNTNLTVQAPGTGTLILNSGGAGTVNLGTTNSTTIGIGNTSAGLTIESGTGTTALFNGATAHNIQLATGAAAQTITIGSTNTTSATNIQSGSGGITLNGNISASGTYNGNTFTNNSLTFSGASTATIQSAASQALNLTGHASSTLSVDSGNLTVDTTAASGTLNLGTGAQAKSIQIGNTSGAVAQTINIGNNATASSATTIVVGSTVGTSPVTIKAGSSGVLVQPADSTTAFQIQNSGATSNLFVADTTNSKVGVGKTPSSSGAILQVAGNVDVTGQYTVNGTQIASTNLADASNLAYLNGTQTFTGATTFSNASNSFTGDGSGLTGLNGSNIASGTVGDARLSNNVALLNANQTASGNKTFTGTVLDQNASDSTTAFQIQNAAGTSNLLIADTTNSKVGIGLAPSASGASLQVSGDISTTGVYRINGTQIASSNLSDGSNLAKLGGSQTFSGTNTFSGATTFQNTILQKLNGTTAFQIQNSSASSNLFIADTTNSKIGIGMLPSSTGAQLQVSGDVNITGQYKVNGTAISSSSLSDSGDLAYLSANQTFTGTNIFSNAGNSFTGSFNGDGSGLGSLNASNVSSGTLNDARLSNNVALLNANQTASGNKTFTGTVLAENATNSTTAFQVQNSLGSTALGVDTTPVNSLLANSNFEGSDVSAWAYLGTPGSVARDTSHGAFSGSASLAVTTSANANNGVEYVTGNGASALATSSTYTLSWYDKLGSGSFTDERAVYARDGSTEVACTGLNTATVVTGGWTRHYCQIVTDSTTPAAGAYIAIEQIGATARTFYLDAVQLDLSSSANAYQETALSFNGVVKSALALRNLNDSTTAFQIQNSSGSLNLMVADTTNGKVGIGLTPSASGALLQVAGDISATGNMSVNGTYQINGVQISSAALSNSANIALLSANQTASGNKTFTGTISFQNASDSTAAVQIQNAAGTSNLLIADTTNTRLAVARSSASYTLDVGGDINSSGTLRIGGSQISTASLSDGSNIGLLNANNTFTGTNTFSGNSTFSGTVLAKNTSNSTTAFQIQNASGTQLLVADTTNLRLYVGNPAGDTTSGTLIVLDNISNSGDPTGVNGAMYYNSTTGKFRCYEASNWTDCLYSSQVAATSSNQTVTATSYGDVTGLGFGVVASKNYILQCTLLVSVTGNGGNISTTGPASPTNYTATFQKTSDQSAGDTFTTSSTYDDGNSTIGFRVVTSTAGTNKFVLTYNAVLNNGSNAGTWQLRAKAVDGSSSISFYPTSTCNLRPF